MSYGNSVSYLRQKYAPQALSETLHPQPDVLSPAIPIPAMRLWLDHPYLKTAWPPEGLALCRVPFVVGRMPDEEGQSRNHVDLVLPDRRPYQLAPVHFCVLNYEGRIAIMDTNSQLGTFVNGVGLGRRTGRNHALLSAGENRITVGSGPTRFVFTLNLS